MATYSFFWFGSQFPDSEILMKDWKLIPDNQIKTACENLKNNLIILSVKMDD